MKKLVEINCNTDVPPVAPMGVPSKCRCNNIAVKMSWIKSIGSIKILP